MKIPNIFGKVTEALGLVKDTIDEVVQSPEERNQIKQRIVEVQADLSSQFIDWHKAYMDMAKQVSTTMLQSDDKFTKRTRPLAGRVFLGLSTAVVIALLLGWQAPTPEAWGIVKWVLITTAAFFGTFVPGRSIEKSVRNNALAQLEKMFKK